MLNNDGLGLAAAGAAQTLGDAILGIDVLGVTTDFANFEKTIQSWEGVVQQGPQSVAALDFYGMADGVREAQISLTALEQSGTALIQQLGPLTVGLSLEIPAPDLSAFEHLLTGLGDVKAAAKETQAALTQGWENLSSGNFRGAADSVQQLSDSFLVVKQSGAGVISSLHLGELGLPQIPVPDMGPFGDTVAQIGNPLSQVDFHGLLVGLDDVKAAGQETQTALTQGWENLSSGNFRGAADSVQQLGDSFLVLKQGGADVISSLHLGDLGLPQIPVPDMGPFGDTVAQIGSRLSQVDFHGLLVGLDDVKVAGQETQTALTQGWENLSSGNFRGAADSVQQLGDSFLVLKQGGADVISSLHLGELGLPQIPVPDMGPIGGAVAQIGNPLSQVDFHGLLVGLDDVKVAGQETQTALTQGWESLSSGNFRGAADSVQQLGDSFLVLKQGGADVISSLHLGELGLPQMPVPDMGPFGDTVAQIGSRLSQVDYRGVLVGLDDVKNAGADAQSALTQGFDQLLQGDFEAAAGNVGPLVDSLSALKNSGADVLASLHLNIDMSGALTSLPQVQNSLSGLMDSARGAAADMTNLWHQGESVASAATNAWASLKAGDVGGTVTGLQGMAKGFLDAKETASGLAGHLQGFLRSAGDAGGAVTQMGGGILKWTQQSGIASAATKVWTVVQGIFNAVMDANPIVLIILAVLALIGIIYLAVKYWDQWTGAIKHAWNMMVEWFSGISGWGDAIAGFFAPLLAIPDTIAASWGVIKQFFVGLWDDFIGGIRNAWNTMLDWFTGLSGWGEAILGFFAPVLAIPMLIAENWGAIKQFFMGIWDELQAVWQMLTDWWNGKISTWDLFGGLWEKIKGWGSNLINMLADGIQAAWNGLSGTVKKTADFLFNFLGFHSPATMGPGADADRWAPNLMSMYVGGIEAGIPDIRDAGNQAASALSVTLTPAIAPMRPTVAAPDIDPVTPAPDQQPIAERQPILTVVAKLVLPDGRELAETIIPVLREGALLGFRG